MNEAIRKMGKDTFSFYYNKLFNLEEGPLGAVRKMIDGTMKYMNHEAVGNDFIKNTYTARYRKYNTEIKHFLCPRESEKTARSAARQYIDFANQYGRMTESTIINGKYIIVCDMKDGFDVVFRKGSLVAGVLGVKEKDVAIKAALEMYDELP